MRVTLVLGTSAGGTGAHVRMLAAGLAGRGIAVTVAGPAPAGARFGFAEVPGVTFAAVEISARGRPGDLAALLRLRRLLLARAPGPGSAGSGIAGSGHVVHAHGLRAGALVVLALLLAGGARRPRVVVTAHNAPPAACGAAGLVYRLLERVAARGADLALCVSPDLEDRMRAAGARHVARAVIAAADGTAADGPAPGAPGLAGAWAGRPVVLAAGRLAPQKGFDVLLDAAARWRDLDPGPLLVIAGDGPLAGQLRSRAAALRIPVAFPGHRDDLPALLAAATVLALPSRWEGQPLLLQEALRAGAAVVATRAGGTEDLAGRGAALLVPPGDAAALGDAIRSVLTDPALAACLRAAALTRAAALPTEADATEAAAAAYRAGAC